jgi:hypothetical protein
VAVDKPLLGKIKLTGMAGEFYRSPRRFAPAPAPCLRSASVAKSKEKISLSRVLSIGQQMRRGCGVSFHQQQT